MPRRVRVGVVGVGFFGRFHARHYAAHAGAELVGVADVDQRTAHQVASELGCAAFTDHRDLFGRVDAASVAVPTRHHSEISRELMEAAIDVLVEKPMAHDVASAVALVKTAADAGRVFQVGHIERFSSSFRALRKLVSRPVFVESNRIAPFRERGSDVDVVFDLMIHDIDIILGLVQSPVTTVLAVGTPVFSDRVDIASARLGFASGCVATVTASRVSHKTQRSLRVFQEGGYLVCDFGESRIFKYTSQAKPGPEMIGAISANQIDVPREDSLANEIDEFLSCILEGRSPTVDGRVGLDAMRIAEKINQNIKWHHDKIARGRRAK
jgi:predicted dehydrogenase